MAILKILVYPDPKLRNVAEPVVEFNNEIRQYVQDMQETMYSASGIGLASIQVAIPKSIVVIDISENRDDLKILINPEIIDREGGQFIEEGCLSFPGYFATVKRNCWVRFRAQNCDGEFYEMEAENLLALCVQHEIDHLTGKLFTDYLSRLKKQRVKKQFEKAAKIRKREQPARV